MIVKQVLFGEDGRAKLMSGIKKMADAVGSTLGPNGRTVVIESESHAGGMTVTKDGVTVARSIRLIDPVEDIAVTMMRQAAEKTATVAGDGTTTATVLTDAIIHHAEDVLEHNTELSRTVLLRQIGERSAEVIEWLDTQRIMDIDIAHVASVSANNDEKLGEFIADVFKEADSVTVENSMSGDTYMEIRKGIVVERGYTSNYYVTDHKKGECVLENCVVLFSDVEIPNLGAIEGILEYVMRENKSILIIGRMSEKASQALLMNVMRRTIKACHIIPPDFGYRMHDLMGDLTKVLGGTYFNDSVGDNVMLAELGDLGSAKKVIVGKESTTIMSDSDPSAYIEELKGSNEETEFLNQRIANISGRVGIIYVGGASDIEQKEKRDRVDDAVCAVNSAKEDGVLPGGGVALYYAADNVLSNRSDGGSIVLRKALRAPFFKIAENCGVDPHELDYVHFSEDTRAGYDMSSITVDGEIRHGDMIEMGIVDPAKVTKNALVNAVSVARTILDSNVVITNLRDNGGDR